MGIEKIVIIHSNNEHIIMSISFPLSMNLNHTLHSQLTQVYGEPDGMFKKGKYSKITTSEDTWKTKIIEHQVAQVSFDENPDIIFWVRENFNLQLRCHPEHNAISLSFTKTYDNQ